MLLSLYMSLISIPFVASIMTTNTNVSEYNVFFVFASLSLYKNSEVYISSGADIKIYK